MNDLPREATIEEQLEHEIKDLKRELKNYKEDYEKVCDQLDKTEIENNENISIINKKSEEIRELKKINKQYEEKIIKKFMES